VPHTPTDDALAKAEIDIKSLLQAGVERGSASPGLVGWELYTGERVLTAWSAAIRRRLLERARDDPTDHEWQ
jgi:hypothetical protein